MRHLHCHNQRRIACIVCHAKASNEATMAFGKRRCFIEKYVKQSRHTEVQCLGDGVGQVVQLCDCDY